MIKQEQGTNKTYKHACMQAANGKEVKQLCNCWGNVKQTEQSKYMKRHAELLNKVCN